METLSGCFAVSVCGFAVMDNHLHVLARLDADEASSWSAEEVIRRWIVAYPPKTAKGEEIEITQAWIDHHAKHEKRVELLRLRKQAGIPRCGVACGMRRARGNWRI
jgi:hypothetical protein